MEKKKVVDTFLKLVSIDAPSFGERKLADYLIERFKQLNICLIEDKTGELSGFQAGNLYAYVEGELSGEPILFSAHMDTVAPAFGKRAVLKEDGKITSDGTTVLGADDMAGIVSILEAVEEIKKNKIPYRSFELLFTVAEEQYCKGAENFDFSVIRSKQAYVFDLSGKVGTAAYAAPSVVSFTVKITGRASHAGFAPEAGISAIKIAAEAISKMKLGKIDEETTANVGMIQGGEGTNIVPEECVVRGEVRSLKQEKVLLVLQQYRDLFQHIADDYGARLDFQTQIQVCAYETEKEHEVVKNFMSACKKLSVIPELVITFGGSDNNIFAAHGIQGLVLATAMNQVHSCEEYTNTEELLLSAEIAKNLMS